MSRDAGDVGSLDAIVAALYDSISFEPGGEPDWERLRTLFHPDGRLIPPRGEDPGPRFVLDVGEFARLSTEYVDEVGIRERGFHEREIGRETRRFGNVAHILSAYESLHSPADDAPFSRGVNSIQLVRDEGRWWLVSIAWDVEEPEAPIPEELGG